MNIDPEYEVWNYVVSELNHLLRYQGSETAYELEKNQGECESVCRHVCMYVCVYMCV